MIAFLKKLFGIKEKPKDDDTEGQFFDGEFAYDTLEETGKPSAFDGIKEPRASFTVTEIQGERIKVEFDWNKPFIQEVRKLGFDGETEEDIVQMFFYASSMRPSHIPMEAEDLTSPAARLSDESNRLVQ